MSRPASGSGPINSRRRGVVGAQTDSEAQGTLRTRAAGPPVPSADPAAMSSRRLSLRSHARGTARPSGSSLAPRRAPAPRRASTDSEAAPSHLHPTQVPQPEARNPAAEARSTTLALFSTPPGTTAAPTEPSARIADQSLTGRARSGSSLHDSLIPGSLPDQDDSSFHGASPQASHCSGSSSEDDSSRSKFAPRRTTQPNSHSAETPQQGRPLAPAAIIPPTTAITHPTRANPVSIHTPAINSSAQSAQPFSTTYLAIAQTPATSNNGPIFPRSTYTSTIRRPESANTTRSRPRSPPSTVNPTSAHLSAAAPTSSITPPARTPSTVSVPRTSPHIKSTSGHYSDAPSINSRRSPRPAQPKPRSPTPTVIDEDGFIQVYHGRAHHSTGGPAPPPHPTDPHPGRYQYYAQPPPRYNSSPLQPFDDESIQSSAAPASQLNQRPRPRSRSTRPSPAPTPQSQSHQHRTNLAAAQSTWEPELVDLTVTPETEAPPTSDMLLADLSDEDFQQDLATCTALFHHPRGKITLDTITRAWQQNSGLTTRDFTDRLRSYALHAPHGASYPPVALANAQGCYLDRMTYIAQSSIPGAGWGLYARQPIPKGTNWLFTGILRCAVDPALSISDSTMEVPHTGMYVDGGLQQPAPPRDPLQPPASLWHTSFMNHYHWNQSLNQFRIVDNGALTLRSVASIAAGEEIFLDYGDIYPHHHVKASSVLDLLRELEHEDLSGLFPGATTDPYTQRAIAAEAALEQHITRDPDISTLLDSATIQKYHLSRTASKLLQDCIATVLGVPWDWPETAPTGYSLTNLPYPLQFLQQPSFRHHFHWTRAGEISITTSLGTSTPWAYDRAHHRQEMERRLCYGGLPTNFPPPTLNSPSALSPLAPSTSVSPVPPPFAPSATPSSPHPPILADDTEFSHLDITKRHAALHAKFLKIRRHGPVDEQRRVLRYLYDAYDDAFSAPAYIRDDIIEMIRTLGEKISAHDNNRPARVLSVSPPHLRPVLPDSPSTYHKTSPARARKLSPTPARPVKALSCSSSTIAIDSTVYGVNRIQGLNEIGFIPGRTPDYQTGTIHHSFTSLQHLVDNPDTLINLPSIYDLPLGHSHHLLTRQLPNDRRPPKFRPGQLIKPWLDQIVAAHGSHLVHWSGLGSYLARGEGLHDSQRLLLETSLAATKWAHTARWPVYNSDVVLCLIFIQDLMILYVELFHESIPQHELVRQLDEDLALGGTDLTGLLKLWQDTLRLYHQLDDQHRDPQKLPTYLANAIIRSDAPTLSERLTLKARFEHRFQHELSRLRQTYTDCDDDAIFLTLAMICVEKVHKAEVSDTKRSGKSVQKQPTLHFSQHSSQVAPEHSHSFQAHPWDSDQGLLAPYSGPSSGRSNDYPPTQDARILPSESAIIQHLNDVHLTPTTLKPRPLYGPGSDKVGSTARTSLADFCSDDFDFDPLNPPNDRQLFRMRNTPIPAVFPEPFHSLVTWDPPQVVPVSAMIRQPGVICSLCGRVGHNPPTCNVNAGGKISLTAFLTSARGSTERALVLMYLRGCLSTLSQGQVQCIGNVIRKRRELGITNKEFQPSSYPDPQRGSASYALPPSSLTNDQSARNSKPSSHTAPIVQHVNHLQHQISLPPPPTTSPILAHRDVSNRDSISTALISQRAQLCQPSDLPRGIIQGMSPTNDNLCYLQVRVRGLRASDDHVIAQELSGVTLVKAPDTYSCLSNSEVINCMYDGGSGCTSCSLGLAQRTGAQLFDCEPIPMQGILEGCTYTTNQYAIFLISILGIDTATRAPVERQAVIHAQVTPNLSGNLVLGSDQNKRFDIHPQPSLESMLMAGGDGQMEVPYVPWERVRQRLHMNACTRVTKAATAIAEQNAQHLADEVNAAVSAMVTPNSSVSPLTLEEVDVIATNPQRVPTLTEQAALLHRMHSPFSMADVYALVILSENCTTPGTLGAREKILQSLHADCGLRISEEEFDARTRNQPAIQQVFHTLHLLLQVYISKRKEEIIYATMGRQRDSIVDQIQQEDNDELEEAKKSLYQWEQLCGPLREELRPPTFPKHLWQYVQSKDKTLVPQRWAAFSPERLAELVTAVGKIRVSQETRARALEEPIFRAHLYTHLDRFGHPDIYNPPKVRGYEYEIILTDTKPIKVKARRMSVLEVEWLKIKAKYMADIGQLRRCRSTAWSNPVMLVPYDDRIDTFVKKHSPNHLAAMRDPQHLTEVLALFRLTGDFRLLNLQTRKDHYPLPNILELLDRFHDCDRYSTADIQDAFFTVRLSEMSRQYTAFAVGGDIYEYLVMPQGCSNSATFWARIVFEIFADLSSEDDGFMKYQDDVVNHRTGLISHLHLQERIYDVLRDREIVFKPTKTAMNFKTQKILGHIVSQTGRTHDPQLTEAIDRLGVPTDLASVRSLMGLAQVAREYIPQLATIMGPIQSLVRKGIDIAQSWTPEHDASLAQLKEVLTSYPVLQMADFNKPFLVHVDSCRLGRGKGAVLLQQCDRRLIHTKGSKSSNAGDWLPVAYWSMALTDAERKMGITELEGTAMHDAILHWEPYLNNGIPFEVITDHHALCYLVVRPRGDKNGRLLRMCLNLQHLNFSVTHRSGVDHLDADAVSRLLRKDEQPYVYGPEDLRTDSGPLTTAEKLHLLERFPLQFSHLRSSIEQVWNDSYEDPTLSPTERQQLTMPYPIIQKSLTVWTPTEESVTNRNATQRDNPTPTIPLRAKTNLSEVSTTSLAAILSEFPEGWSTTRRQHWIQSVRARGRLRKLLLFEDTEGLTIEILHALSHRPKRKPLPSTEIFRRVIVQSVMARQNRLAALEPNIDPAQEALDRLIATRRRLLRHHYQHAAGIALRKDVYFESLASTRTRLSDKARLQKHESLRGQPYLDPHLNYQLYHIIDLYVHKENKAIYSCAIPEDYNTTTPIDPQLLQHRRVEDHLGIPGTLSLTGSFHAQRIRGQDTDLPKTTAEWLAAQLLDPELRAMIDRIQAPGIHLYDPDPGQTRNRLGKKAFYYRASTAPSVGNRHFLGPLLRKYITLHSSRHNDTEIIRNQELSQLIVPKAHRTACLCIYHEYLGHPGSSRGARTMRQRYYWAGLKQDMSRHVKQCTYCTSRKVNLGRGHIPVQKYETALQPMDRFHHDTSGPHTITTRNNRFINVGRDALTGFVTIFPSPSKEAEEVATGILRNVFFRLGPAKIFITDRGTEYNNQTLSEIMRIWSTHHIATTPQNPRSDGMAENFMKTMKDMLSAYVNDFQDDWDNYLDMIAFLYNTTVSDASGYSPFYLMYGREAKVPYIPDQLPPPERTITEYLRGLTAALRYTWRTVGAQDEQKNTRYNKAVSIRREFIPFKVGDYFYHRAIPHKFHFTQDEAAETAAHQLKAAMQNRFIGPFLVTGVLNDVCYSTVMNGQVRIVHALNMKRV